MNFNVDLGKPFKTLCVSVIKHTDVAIHCYIQLVKI